MSLKRAESTGRLRRSLSQSVASADEGSISAKKVDVNALRFKQWLQNKSLRERAIELLGKISQTRSEDDGDLKEVAIALCAVDELMSKTSTELIENVKEILKDGMDKEDGGKAVSKNLTEKKGPKPLSMHWMKWAMEAHSFNMVVLSDADAASLSAAVHEYLDTNEDGKKVLPSLKYFFPAVPKKPNEKAKPLTNDQKVQNGLYMKEMKRVWREAKTELRERVDEYVARKTQQMMKASEAGDDLGNLRMKLDYQALNEMSLKQMNMWVEEDEDKLNMKNKEDEQERLKMAKSSHEQWVRSKDGLKIRIPDNLTVKTPPITYGREFSGVRPQTGPSALSIIKSMADSGLKYIHASGRGKQGTDGDLEKTRKQLLELGHVYRENFDPEDRHEYRTTLRNNPALHERILNDKKSKEDSSKAYEEWLIYKDMKDQAVKCLSLLPIENIGKRLDESQSSISLHRQSVGSANMSIRKSSVPQPIVKYADDDYKYVIDIGKALKKVDRTLFTNWSKWCENVFKPNIASILWDSFQPIACDVHSLAYSQIRDTFVKLLRPGFDYKATFIDFVKKQRQRENDYDDRADEKELMGNFAVTKDQMQTLLRQMGIVMKGAELRLLIDAFDVNNDGTVTLQEFIEFTGPKRDKKSGSGMALNRRCCWITTCKVTGMANAFVVSAMPKNSKGSGLSYLLESKGSDEKYMTSSRDSKDDCNLEINGLAGKIQIKSMPNGEKRMCVELKERKYREDLLRSYNLIPKPSSNSMEKAVGKGSKTNRSGRDTKDEYDDDFDDAHEDNYDEDFDDGNRPAGSTQDATAKGDDKCDASKWSKDDRAAGLQYLLDISADARQEDMLKQLLTKGKPPIPPKFWCEYNLNSYESIERNVTDELRLYWSSQPGDLVSFYSLEFAGVSKFSQGSDVVYREIYRDPADAHPDSKFSFGYVKTGLQPGTSYLFRLRAFNGYGPGEFVYKVFTTKTTAPPAPRAIKVSADAVVLRWLFSDSFFQQMNELKNVFKLADSDKSGSVSREELSAALDDKISSSVELKKFLSKVASIRGIDVSRGFSAMFDLIEGDDDNYLSWEEFEQFFMSAGWADTSIAGNSIVSVQDKNRTISQPSNANKQSPQSITYIVEKCESEFDDIYSIAVRTTQGQVMISRLEPGQSYRFRVYSLNAEGVPGPKSESVVVHTMLETPPNPSVAPSGLGTTSLNLTWKPRVQFQSTRNKQVVNRMLGDWAGTHLEEDKGVSIEAAFAKYDRDGSGDIDSSEIALMLSDLGVQVTEERIRQAIDTLDINGDGKISFEEFGKWWRADDVIYTLKRSEAIVSSIRTSTLRAGIRSFIQGKDQSILNDDSNQPARAFGLSMIPEETNTLEISGLVPSKIGSNSIRPKSAPRSRGQSNSIELTSPAPQQDVVLTKDVPVPIISYRGPQTKVTISGLEPNRLYHFKLRYIGSRSNSMISKPLVIMTLPLPPTQPILAILASMMVRVKWYPSQYGAFKFSVQIIKAIPVSVTRKGLSNATFDLSDGWTTVFTGQETTWTSTTLAPETNYRLRVVAINCQGSMSAPSPEISFTTPHRNETSKDFLSPKALDSTFSIECTNDICVGDTIIITERLYAKSKSESITSEVNAKAKSATARDMRASTTSMMSVASLLSDGKPESSGTFIGERTIAAHVIKDNYKTVRDILQVNGDPKGFTSGQLSANISKHRRLWLEVVWQKSKSPACKPYEMKAGDIIERQQSKLESYEVFRCPWTQEEQRIPLLKEWISLNECYIAMDC